MSFVKQLTSSPDWAFANPTGGFNFLTNIRTYPAVLLLYAYGIGLLKAQRFAELFKLFSAPISTGRDHNPPIASHLLLTRWEGTENDPWQLISEVERAKTALSDHLHKLFSSWTEDYLFTTGEYTSLFEHFELPGTLADITLSNDKATLQAAIQQSDFIWAPIGRASWDSRTSRPILESWKRDLQPRLLQAGFARGEKEYLLLAMENIARFSKRLAWR